MDIPKDTDCVCAASNGAMAKRLDSLEKRVSRLEGEPTIVRETSAIDVAIESLCEIAKAEGMKTNEVCNRIKRVMNPELQGLRDCQLVEHILNGRTMKSVAEATGRSYSVMREIFDRVLLERNADLYEEVRHRYYDGSVSSASIELARKHKRGFGF